jgi:hypothetical protein
MSDKLNKSLTLYELGRRKEGVELFAEAMGLKKGGSGHTGQGRRLVKAGLKGSPRKVKPKVEKRQPAKQATPSEEWEEAKTMLVKDEPSRGNVSPGAKVLPRKADRPKRKRDEKD